MAECRPVRPHERPLKPLTETDGDETVVDNLGDDDAGEMSAVRSKIQPIKPSDKEIATHEACGHYPYLDWCRACVGGTWLSDAHKRQWETQHTLLTASMDYASLEATSRDDGEHTREATPFLVVNVKSSMMIWSIPVQSKGVEDQAAIKETVESLNRLGYQELIVRSDNESAMLTFRDAVIRLLCPSNRRTSTKIRLCVSWHGGKCHQAGQGESANPGDCDT